MLGTLATYATYKYLEVSTQHKGRRFFPMFQYFRLVSFNISDTFLHFRNPGPRQFRKTHSGEYVILSDIKLLSISSSLSK
jgi:hypothetical protein